MYAQKRSKLRTVLRRLHVLVRQKFCSHEFDLDDLHKTGIEFPEKPKDAPLDELIKYQQELYTCDAHTKRVSWPCAKCRKTFYAHFGLEIAPKHGPIIRKANRGIDGKSPSMQ